MKVLFMLMLLALPCAALDYTYSTNFFGANDIYTNVYIGTNSSDTNRDSLYMMMNKINHNGARFSQMFADAATNANTVSNLVNVTVKTNGITANGQIPYSTNYAPGFYWAAPPTGGGGSSPAVGTLWLYNVTQTKIYPSGNYGTNDGWINTNGTKIHPL